MKKLNLDLDQLAVESFDTSAAVRPRGTVRGFDITDSTCYDEGCACLTNRTCDTNCNQETCGASCYQICAPTNAGEHTCNQPSCFYSCTCPPPTDFCL